MWGGLTWIKDNPITQINADAIDGVEISGRKTGLMESKCIIWDMI